MPSRLHPELMFHLRSLSPFIYFVTEEEDRTLLQIASQLKKHEKRTHVFDSALGLKSLTEVIDDWKTRTHASNNNCDNIHSALVQMYKEDSLGAQNFYIITDPERWLPDPHVQRRILNLAHQLSNNPESVKVTIFISNRLAIPPKLARHIEVIHDRGLNDEDYEEMVQNLATKVQLKNQPSRGTGRYLKGLTSFEARASLTQSIVQTYKDENGEKTDPRIDPKFIGEYKRKQLHKTSLLQYLDTSDFNFSQVGGLDRFKAWAESTRLCWTEEGQKYGLEPPKGILAVGVWGCGKSLCVKALGSTWRLPVVQLEMGRLRSSGVGETEANVYRAINLIEGIAPCIVYVDEAEKSFSGSHSSSHSDAGTTARTIGILSTWLQETKSQVCFALTANSLKTLPVEFVNRLEERFFFDLPNEDERIEIIKIHLRKKKLDPAAFQLANLSEAAKHMVGREIEQAIKAALRESFQAGKDSLDESILLEEMKRKPRIFKTMVDELKEVLEWVGFDPDLNDGIRAKFASAQRSETFREFKV